jgi:transcriptional regulator with XRE-family HTH domain
MKTQRFDCNKLKELREKQGLSKSEFVLMLHDAGLTLSRPTYDKYEDTGDDLEVKDLELIAQILKVNPEVFFTS